MTAALATRISAALVAFYVIALWSFVGPMQGWPGAGGKVERQSDYVAIWTGGRIAVDGQPAEAYDWERHREAQERLLGQPPGGTLVWSYPPTFLVVAAAFALIPFGTSMLAWIVLTWGAFAAAAARIMGTWQGALWLSVPVAGFLNAMTGHNGFLSAALLGFALAYLPVRPVLAGVCFGLLSYKPHLGPLIPLALIAAGRWRAFAAAAVAAVAFAALSVILFGVAPWAEFLPGLAKVSAKTAVMTSPEKLQSLFGLARSLGVEASPAYALQAALAIVAAAAVWLAWRSDRLGYDLKSALLAAATLLVSPYLFVYDLTVLTLAQAFLYRAARPAGFDPVEIAGLILANVAVLFFAAAGVPLGFGASLIVAALVVRRAIAVAGLRPSLWLARLRAGDAGLAPAPRA